MADPIGSITTGSDPIPDFGAGDLVLPHDVGNARQPGRRCGAVEAGDIRIGRAPPGFGPGATLVAADAPAMAPDADRRLREPEPLGRGPERHQPIGSRGRS